MEVVGQMILQGLAMIVGKTITFISLQSLGPEHFCRARGGRAGRARMAAVEPDVARIAQRNAGYGFVNTPGTSSDNAPDPLAPAASVDPSSRMPQGQARPAR